MESLNQLFNLIPTKYKFKFILLIVLSLIGIFFEMIGISLVIPIIASLNGDTKFIDTFASKFNLNIDTSFYTSEKLFLILIFVFIIKISILIFNIYFQNKTMFSFFSHVVNKLYSLYILKDISFHLKKNSADLIRNIMLNTHNMTVGFLGSVISIIVELILVLGICILISIIQSSLVLISVLTIFLIAGTIVLGIKNKIKKLGKDRDNLVLLDLKYLMESIGAIKDIKIYEKENEAINLYQQNIIKLCKLNAFVNTLNALPKQILELFIIITIVVILTIFIKLNFSIVEIISYMSLLVVGFIRILPSINKLVVSLFNISYYKNSVEIIFKDFSDAENENKDSENLINNKFKKEVSFNNTFHIKDLSFSHMDGEKKIKIFKNVNVKFRKGEIIGIVGETGSGKSTLIDIIVGFLKPDEGTFIVDEIETQIFKNNKWKSKIGYVPQNVFLKDDTIMENVIFYESENITDKNKFNEAINSSKLSNFINSLKNGALTLIGEKGSRISGGQRQRIGIARALYKDCEILVFDEATNALDPETESLIMENIFQFRMKKTVLIVTHKLKNLEKCDQIYKIENFNIKKIK